MSDEIKEILDYFRKYATIRENTMISEIEDCITNLQNENENLKNQVEHLNEFNYENEMYKIRCKRALKLVNNLITDDECFYIYDILENKKQELKHILKGDYEE